MLAMLSMANVEYQLWRSGIPYTQRVSNELDMRSSMIPVSCLLLLLQYMLSLSLLIHFHSFFALLRTMTFTWDTCVRLVPLLVLLSTLLTYRGRSISMVLMALLESIRWVIT